MRVHDRAIPGAGIPDPTRPPWMSGQLVVALERLPQAAYVWDDEDPDVTWDDTTPERVWDAPFVGSGLTDVWCDMISLTIIHGQADLFDQYRTSSVLLELKDPGDGRYRARTVDGRLVYYAPGRRLAVWWTDPDGEPWWLFDGQLSTWRERLDGTVGIEAYSGSLLGRSTGESWTAGAPDDFLQQRVAKILAAPNVAHPGPSRVDLGDARLLVPAAADVSPLDAIRQAAWSDGGIVYTDADDTLVVRDRRWRSGRDDQTVVPILSDNVCDGATIVVWSPETADDQMRLAGRTRFENIATPPLVATATAPVDRFADPSTVFSHPGQDLWSTQAEGDALALFSVNERSMARVALSYADVYLHDRRFDYWAAALDRRLGDRVRFVHTDVFGDGVYDVTAVITTLQHSILPGSWIVNMGTSPAVAYTAVELWDMTRFVYDDPDPLAVYR